MWNIEAEDDVDSYSAHIECLLENSGDYNSDTSESVDLMGETIRDILIAQKVSEANDLHAVNGNISRNDKLKCKKAQKMFLEPSNIFFHGRDTQMRSHPIPLALLKDIDEFPQMRVISGEPPEDMELSAPGDLVSEPGKASDEDRVWNLNKAAQNSQEHNHMRKNGTNPGNPDDLTTNAFVLCLENVERKKTKRGSCSSSPIPTLTAHESRLYPSNIVRLSKEQKSLTPFCDRSVNLGDVLIEGNSRENLETEKIFRSELCSTEDNEGCGIWSTQPNAMTGCSITCIKRDADKTEKKWLTKSILNKFDLMNVTQINVFPPDAAKRTQKDECERSIADISEKLEYYLPEEAWYTPSSEQFRRRSRQGERSSTKSVSSFAPSVNPSTADIFDAALVHEISKEHSYLKPHSNKGNYRNWISYHLPPQSLYPTVSAKARYVSPFEAKETKPLFGIEKPPEDKSWFSSIFSNIGFSAFI